MTNKKEAREWEQKVDYFFVGRFKDAPSGDLRDLKNLIRTELKLCREAAIEQIKNLRISYPMDLQDETLADIAADTKADAWKLGYNAALDEALATLTPSSDVTNLE